MLRIIFALVLLPLLSLASSNYQQLHVDTEAALLAGLGDPSVAVLVVTRDITFTEGSLIPGAAPSGIFELTRNVTIMAPLGAAWYPALDFSLALSPKLRYPRGITVRFERVMTIQRSVVQGLLFSFFDQTSTGLIMNVGTMKVMGACLPRNRTLAFLGSLPRPASHPGKQQVMELPVSVCVMTCSDCESGGFLSQQLCWYTAFRLVDLVFNASLLLTQVYSTLAAAGSMQVINTTLLCDNVISEACILKYGVYNCTQMAFEHLANTSSSTIKSAAPSPGALTDGSPSTDVAPAPSGDSGLSTGVIIGVVVGTFCGLLLVVAIAAAVYFRRHVRGCLELSTDDAPPSSVALVTIETGPDMQQNSLPDTPISNAKEATNQLIPGLSNELLDMTQRIRVSMLENHLVINAVIGSGAFGTVYKGTWKGLPVAVKSLLFSSDVDEGVSSKKDRVLMEAAISKSLAHPNVVSTYHCDIKPISADEESVDNAPGLQVHAPDGVINHWRVYIIQELCEGGPLLDALQCRMLAVDPGGCPEMGLERVLDLALGISSGLAHLHERNIIHGDLNPANVLLKTVDDRLIPKVCDFGFSVHLPALRSHVSNVRRGTPCYMAPEVSQRGNLGKAADVYALGVMLWELYMSRVIWQVGPSGALVANPAFPSLPPGAPSSYAQLVTACVDSDPTRRPAMSSVLERLLEVHAAQGFIRGLSQPIIVQ